MSDARRAIWLVFMATLFAMGLAFAWLTWPGFFGPILGYWPFRLLVLLVLSSFVVSAFTKGG